MAARSFLFGFITIPMYEYRCVLSLAQIELLMADKPVVVYPHKNKKGKKGDKPDRPSKASIEEAKRKWEEKYKDGAKPAALDLSGFIIKKK